MIAIKVMSSSLIQLKMIDQMIIDWKDQIPSLDQSDRQQNSVLMPVREKMWGDNDSNPIKW